MAMAYPAGQPADRTLLYLHGGGFVSGVTLQHVVMVAYLTRTTRIADEITYGIIFHIGEVILKGET